VKKARRRRPEPGARFVAAVAVFVFRGGRLLAMRRSRGKDAAPGAWESISGRVLPGEDPLAAARRETLEESGLRVSLDPRPIAAYTAKRARAEMLVVAYRARARPGRVRRSAEHDAWAWMTPGRFARVCRFPRLVAAARTASREARRSPRTVPDGSVVARRGPIDRLRATEPAGRGTRSPGPAGGRPGASATIDHVVLIVKENHGFDNYFGTFPGADGARLARSPNPPPVDPDHRHEAWLTRAATAVRAQFVEADIPAYFDYARRFTLCDRYFTDVAGPSTPNHLMLIAADSPIIDNPPRYRLPRTQPLFDLPTLPEALDKAGLTWGNYGGYAFDFFKGLHGRAHYDSGKFREDALAGTLPSVSWVYAPHDASEHPPDPGDRSNPLVGDVTHGMQWTVEQVDAIVRGGLWPKVAVFITWDDWGGWYDHVDPPVVETWRDGTPFRYGSRVPCLVLGPYARSGLVSSVPRSHVSLLRFCETLFGLPPLGARDRAADDMRDCFDFARPPAGPPPPGGAFGARAARMRSGARATGALRRKGRRRAR
jgi:phospholipase C